MSRCFPFPTIGYSGKVTSNVPLIDLIKLQEERENSIPGTKFVKSSDKMKDRKREKKDKKKDQKDRKINEKEKLHSEVGSEKLLHNDKLDKVDSVQEECKGKQSFEVFEKSNLTEEHGRPVDLQNVSCSSDSTGNSGKRKRHVSPATAASSIQGNGNIIRIRLSSQRRDNASTSGSMPCEDHPTSQNTFLPCSRQESLISQKDVSKVQEPFIGQKHLISKVREPYNGQKDVMPKVCDPSNGQKYEMPKVHDSLRDVLTSTDTLWFAHAKKMESLAPREGPTSSGRIETREPSSKKLSSNEKKMLKRESLYTKLFENLVPPTVESELAVGKDGDDYWLFGNDIEGSAKRVRGGSDDVHPCLDNLPCSASIVLQPRAHYLSDVGVYALPFTVPF